MSDAWDIAKDAWNGLTEGAKDYGNVGKNQFVPQHYLGKDVYFGGDPDGANRYTQQAYDQMGATQDGQAYALDQMQQERGPQAFEDPRQVAMQNAARNQQMQAVGLARSAAMGNAPSVAALQMQQGLNQAVAGQHSQAASARGNAGLALAGANAGANVASLQNQTYNQAAQLRAQEMAQARGQYLGGSDALRGSDLGRMAQGSHMSQFNANLNDDYRVKMGMLGNQFGQTNNTWFNSAMAIQKAQMDAAQATENRRADMFGSKQALEAGQYQAEADRRQMEKERHTETVTNAIGITGKKMESAHDWDE